MTLWEEVSRKDAKDAKEEEDIEVSRKDAKGRKKKKGAGSITGSRFSVFR